MMSVSWEIRWSSLDSVELQFSHSSDPIKQHYYNVFVLCGGNIMIFWNRCSQYQNTKCVTFFVFLPHSSQLVDEQILCDEMVRA